MSQSKKMSFVEAVTNVLIGYTITFTANALIMPLFVEGFTVSDNLIMGLIYTVISVCRSYCIRRIFNKGKRPLSKSEICICAAIKLKNGKIFRGHRHCHCIASARAAKQDIKFKVDGFMTSENRFVNRIDAMILQRNAGVQSSDPMGYRGSILFSEDLY